MAARRPKQKKRNNEPQKEELTKEETAVAKHIRFNLSTKKTTIMGQQGEYFTAAKAVDMLLDSKWASGKTNETELFTTRQTVVDYLDGLLQKGLFYRAVKVFKEKKEKDKEKKEAKEKGDAGEKKIKKKKKERKENEDTPTGKKLKEVKRKFKLEPHDEQIFIDGSDAYVWVYDPTHPKTFIMGLLLVIGAAAVCLFPLWPWWMRLGTYYISLVAACLVGGILVLALFRCILFVFIWIFTMGKHHFWLLPNLMADVGILESFKPFYTHEVSTTEKNKDDTDAKNKKEEKQNEENQEEEEKESGQDSDDEAEQKDEDDDDADKDVSEKEETDTASKNEKENINGSKNGEGFEVIHQEEISAATEDMEESDSQQS
uniref:Translocation protein SEC62 n=1 Tax=Saccoglossus kowalevskii TaxID=10224 RepID=A0ABM0GV56_SACKO|nr:PREDICTED: translocation protein SEC62-like [Saccoglossus kowalevskii]